jgi:hypothetical protein
LLHPLAVYPRGTPLLRYLREVPLAWFLAGLAIAKLGQLLTQSLSPQRRLRCLRLVALCAGLLVLCLYLAINLDSLRCFLIQQDEANIFSIAGATLRGLPMYHPPVSPDYSYSLMYGPLTFLIYTVALAIGGVTHFWIMRAAVVAAALLVGATLFVLLRKFVSTPTAIALLAFPLSVLLQHPEISLSTRGDIWIFLFTTLAILSSYLELEPLAILLTGICGGLILGLKISAAPAILFPLLIIYRKFGLRASALCLLPVAAIAAAPFALPNISFANYMLWISFTRSEGLSPISMFSNFLFALFLLSPCLLMELTLRRSSRAFHHRIPEFLLILLCLLLAVLTSKNGSGLHYVWHVVPSILVYLALAARDLSEIPAEQRAIPLYSIAIACTVFTCAYLPRAYGYVQRSIMPPGVAAAQLSINHYLLRYRDHSSIQMGYDSIDADYRTELRYILVEKGQPYTFEGNPGRFETLLLPFPVNVLNRMENCTDDVWLVPHAQAPFELYLFPRTLAKTFRQNYSIDTSDDTYDAWVCNRAKPR